jgi:hypothetical protein
MKNLWICTLLCGILAASISCEQDALQDLNIDEEGITDIISENDLSEDCLELVFPLEVKLPDGNIEEVADGAALEELFSGYEDEEFPEFVFPLQVLNEEEEEFSVSEEEYYILLEACESDSDEEDCIELVFPITVELSDGTIQEVEDEDALEAIYESITDDEGEPQFQFPITVLFDEVELTVSEEELDELEESCSESDEEDGGWFDILEEEACFDFVYPVFLTMPNGDVLSIEDGDFIGELVEEWYTEHPDANGEPELHYPLELVFDEIDLAYTANNEEELWGAFEYCEEDDEQHDDFLDIEDWCFELILPVSLIMPDGSELEIGPDQEILSLIENWYEESDQEWDEVPELVFPVSILYDDQSELELFDEESFKDAIEDCE